MCWEMRPVKLVEGFFFFFPRGEKNKESAWVAPMG